MIIVFDLNFLLHRSLKTPEIFNFVSSSGLKTGGVWGVLQCVQNTYEGTSNITKSIGVWDGKRSERRKKVFPGYKENRTPKTDQDRVVFEEYFSVFNTQKQIIKDKLLTSLGIMSLTFPTKEADDVIYKVCELFENEELLVVSEDQDLLQLLGYFNNVRIYQPVKKLMVTKENFKTLYEIPIELFLFKKAILGDRSDNIPNVPGIGEVTVNKILSEVDINNAKDVLYSIAKKYHMAYNDTLDKYNKKFRREANLFEHWGTFIKNLDLIDLRREDFNNSDLINLKQTINSFNYSFNKSEFKNLCQFLEVNKILNNFDFYCHQFEKHFAGSGNDKLQSSF